jgi:hypothetical protein
VGVDVLLKQVLKDVRALVGGVAVPYEQNRRTDAVAMRTKPRNDNFLEPFQNNGRVDVTRGRGR